MRCQAKIWRPDVVPQSHQRSQPVAENQDRTECVSNIWSLGLRQFLVHQALWERLCEFQCVGIGPLGQGRESVPTRDTELDSTEGPWGSCTLLGQVHAQINSQKVHIFSSHFVCLGRKCQPHPPAGETWEMQKKCFLRLGPRLSSAPRRRGWDSRVRVGDFLPRTHNGSTSQRSVGAARHASV